MRSFRCPTCRFKHNDAQGILEHSKTSHIDDIFRLAYWDESDDLYKVVKYEITVRDAMERLLYVDENLCLREQHYSNASSDMNFPVKKTCLSSLPVNISIHANVHAGVLLEEEILPIDK